MQDLYGVSPQRRKFIDGNLVLRKGKPPVKQLITTVVLLFVSGFAEAKSSRKTVITVVDSNKIVNTSYWTDAGRAGYSKTNCDESATATPTATGAIASGSTNCTTSYVPPVAPQVTAVDNVQVTVQAIVEDQRVWLWCRFDLRDCRQINPGTYSAEVKDKSVWIMREDTLTHKPLRIKYKIVNNW